MKCNEIESNAKNQKHVAKFEKVLDGRGHPIRGLVVRDGRYYARLSAPHHKTGMLVVQRIPLKTKDDIAVESKAQAVTELKRLQTQRDEGTLPVLHRTPKFSDYVTQYLDLISTGNGAKKPATIQKERSILKDWVKSLGDLRLDQIKRVHINRFKEGRIKDGISERTTALDIIAVRNVFKRAVNEGYIQRLPMEGMKTVKKAPDKRPYFTNAEIESVCSSATSFENGQQLSDYIRLMALCGARRNEALGVQWADVDFEKGKLHLCRQVSQFGIQTLKNDKGRDVDFSPMLRTHLADMFKRRAPDSIWLFPSSRRGEKDNPCTSFQKTFKLARIAAKLPNFHFHDCRHHFISICVMSGIDYMTIAEWVGHSDGGILIGKVYGHLADGHKKAMASKVNFAPTIVEKSEVA